MGDYRLAELLDMSMVQKLADSNFSASGIPMSIIDTFDTSILVRAGWTDICTNFHRACPASCKRCVESDASIKGRLKEGEAHKYRCKNGLWHVAIPIIVSGRHMATMFLTQFYFEGEVPERDYFIRQAAQFGYDLDAYLAALDKMPVFSIERVEYIIGYDKALVRFISDIAEHSIKVIETRKSLIESEEKYRTLINNVHIGVYRNSGIDGRFLSINPAIVTIFGYESAEEFMNIAAGELYRDRADREEFIRDIKSKGFLKDRELRMKKKDGTPILCSATVTAQFNADGEMEWIDGVIEDITERKNIEERILRLNEELERRVVERTRQLELANSELMSLTSELRNAYADLKSAQLQVLQQEKLASIGQIAAGVAHEINNPMGFIMSNLSTLIKYTDRIADFIRMVEDKIGTDPSQAALKAVINEQRSAGKLDYIMADIGNLIRESLDGAERVKKIVADLKSFSRLDEAAFKMADINQGIESTINIIWNELKYKVTLKREFGDIPMTMCNLGQLNQVFMNIILNAAQAITEHGEVVVKTWSDGTSIFISIKDSGSGIPADKLSRIFEPFYTTKEAGKGTGLGLSIAYDIIRKHKGEINVASEPDKGTTFTISIPVALK